VLAPKLLRSTKTQKPLEYFIVFYGASAFSLYLLSLRRRVAWMGVARVLYMPTKEKAPQIIIV
jgi:hypothetical protein